MSWPGSRRTDQPPEARSPRSTGLPEQRGAFLEELGHGVALVMGVAGDWLAVDSPRPRWAIHQSHDVPSFQAFVGCGKAREIKIAVFVPQGASKR